MMMASTELDRIRKRVIPILRRRGIVRAGIFGSFARGEQKRTSDLDMLVEVPDGFSLLDLVNLEHEIEDKIGGKRKADVNTYKAIHPLLKDRVLEEEIRIL